MKTPDAFMEYFRANYPGPSTVISKPDWHAPKIYAAAIDASGHAELLEACRVAIEWLRRMPVPRQFWEDHGAEHREAVRGIEDAIAKAEPQ